MASERKEAGGFVGVLMLPSGEFRAVLRRRGEIQIERDEDGRVIGVKPETWPGGFQVTTHGKRKPKKDPDLQSAVIREAHEEVGGAWAEWIAKNWTTLVELPGKVDTPESLTVTWGGLISLDLFAKLRLAPESGGIRLVGPADIDNIQDFKDFDKKRGVPDLGITAMHLDEKEAVRYALAHFNRS